MQHNIHRFHRNKVIESMPTNMLNTGRPAEVEGRIAGQQRLDILAFGENDMQLLI